MQISQQQIDDIFAIEHEHQANALILIYKLILPNWEEIKEIHGSPAIGDEGWKYICKCFMKFDKAHHPDVLAGGCWMNKGFSVDPSLKSWEVSMENCILHLKENGNE